MRVDTNQHPSLADDLVKTPSNDLMFLNEIINWSKIENKLKVNLKKRDYSLLSLFKSLLLQRLYNLSDNRLSEGLHRDLVFMKFCGFSLGGNKPDAGTVCRYRNELVKEGLLESLFVDINKQLQEQGYKLSAGNYSACDATLVSSARRPRKRYEGKEVKKREYEVETKPVYSADLGASYKRKGNKSVYGYGAFFATDKEGLVDAVTVKSANEHESRHALELIDKANLPKGTRVCYDKAADSRQIRTELKKRGLKTGIMYRKKRGKQESIWSKRFNKGVGVYRYVAERTFGTCKQHYGLSRFRYIGSAKILGQVVMTALVYNLRRAINIHKAGLCYTG